MIRYNDTDMGLILKRSDGIDGAISAFTEMAYAAGFTDDKVSFTDILLEAFVGFVETTFTDMCEENFGEYIFPCFDDVGSTDTAVVLLPSAEVMAAAEENPYVEVLLNMAVSEAKDCLDGIVDIAFEKLGARLSKVEE